MNWILWLGTAALVVVVAACAVDGETPPERAVQERARDESTVLCGQIHEMVRETAEHPYWAMASLALTAEESGVYETVSAMGRVTWLAVCTANSLAHIRRLHVQVADALAALETVQRTAEGGS